MMSGKAKIYCMGVHCPVRNSCMRYTAGRGATMYDGTIDRFIRQCRNEKLYVSAT